MANSLFDRTKLGSMRLKNRIFMSPMGTTGEADGSYNNEAIDYFEERAKGGVGMIITGANVISTKYEPRPCTELSNFHHVERLNMLIDRCHHYGAKVCVQLSPGLGRQQFTDPFTPPYSAGSVPSFWFPKLICKPFAKEDIHYLVKRIGYSASLAINAGADALELHDYGGYLLDQFQSKQWNNRTDEYGGSLENRMRFTLECIKSIQDNIPKDFPLLVKFTPDQRVKGFRTLDEGLKIAKILEQAGVTALHVDTGCYEQWYQAITTVYSPEASKLDVQKAVKDVVDIPVLGDGKLKNPVTAKKVIEDGDLDYVGLAKQMLADPFWVKKVKSGHIDDIVPCIGCNECLRAGFSGKHYYCTVNPQCYAEKEYRLPKNDGKQRSVLVIGGGPAGMEAAITARQRGFSATIWEQSDRLGGLLWAASAPSFKHDVRNLLNYLVTQCNKHGVNVLYNTKATDEKLARAQGQYDEVILATGSSPVTTSIPGMKENATFAIDYLNGKAQPTGHIAIVGAGLTGTETACDLAEKGYQVDLFEQTPEILQNANECLNNQQHLLAKVADDGVKVHTSATVKEVGEGQLTFADKDGEEQTLPFDTILNAIGFRSNDQLADELYHLYDDHANVIGDALQPRKIMNAIHEGYHTIRTMD
ncbi:MAG: NAD(P)/FAD-dependent oxidoreductase [Limosilactobacillus sp.]